MTTHTVSGEDTLEDSPAEIARHHPALQRVLQASTVVAKAFKEADTRAERFHRRHTWCSNAAILFGAAAVVMGATLAVFPPPDHDHRNWMHSSMLWAEFVAAFVALAAVAVGDRGDIKMTWLRARNEAERYRLLKFAWVIDPGRWPMIGSETAPSALLMKEVRLMGTEAPNFESWIKVDSSRPAVNTTPIDAALIDDLLDYYRTNRLARQMKFFQRRHDEHGQARWLLRRLPLPLFYVSVAFVFFHALADFGELTTHSHVFLLVAIVLPVVGAAARAAAVVEEPPRNSARYAAKLNALSAVEARLGSLTAVAAREGDHTEYCSQILDGLAQCEYIFESDHREWTRLMTEAEWF